MTIMNNDIELKIREFLVKNILFVEVGYALADDASFLADGVIDSLGIIELADYIRREFGLQVPLRDIVPANFDSISGLAAYVRRQLAEAQISCPVAFAGPVVTPGLNGQMQANAC